MLGCRILDKINNPYEIGLTHRQLAWSFAATGMPQETFFHALKAMALLKQAAPRKAERMGDDERSKIDLPQPINTCLELATRVISKLGWSHFSTIDLPPNITIARFRLDKNPDSVDDLEYEITLNLTWSPEQNSTAVEFDE